MDANKEKASERLQGSEKIGPEASSREGKATQASGIRARGSNAGGLEKDRGTVSGCFLPATEPLYAGETDMPKDRASAPRVFKIPVAVRVLLGRRKVLVQASPAVLIAQNDNRRAHAGAPIRKITEA
ncbi:hypothetical protein C1M53_31525 [Mesorhizobium sp. Pch-S]|nr:hypothetical protein C1M53_31525 [Mesorhizobium sp. Pch-S]